MWPFTSWEISANGCNENRFDRMNGTGGDFRRIPLRDGICLNLNSTAKFKTIRIDLFLHVLLEKRSNTRIALISRLLERGTARLPNLRKLHRFLDSLFGAHFAVEIEQMGDRQVIHFCLEILDRRFLGKEHQGLLVQGMEFLHDVMRDPVGDGDRFLGEFLRQDKNALAANIKSLFNDKMEYAQYRCIEEMCAGEPYALSPLGDVEDFGEITAENLWEFHADLQARAPIEIFVTGEVDCREIKDNWEVFFDWERRYKPSPVSAIRLSKGRAKRIAEAQRVGQGRLIMGYRTGTGLADGNYPALALFNLLWGGDGNSLLFRSVREKSGLCYSIASWLEALCGMMFVTAGLEEEDLLEVLEGIDGQLEEVRKERFEVGELEAAKSMLKRRLFELEDDREGMVRFHLRQGMAGRNATRAWICRKLDEVTPFDIGEIARKLELETTFFLHDKDAAVPWCT